MPVNRLIFSKFGAIVWLAVVFTAIALLAPFWNAPGHSLKVAAEHSVDIRNNPVNLILLYGVFVLDQIDPRAGPRLFLPALRGGMSRAGDHVPGLHSHALCRCVNGVGFPINGTASSSARRA